MKGLLLNTLIGLLIGRFGTVWWLPIFLPIVAAEVAFGVYVYDLSLGGGVRRGVVLLICGQFACLLGALMRPMRGET